MAAFATTDDMELLWRSMTDDEIARAEALLDVVSNLLRYEAQKVGKDLDEMIEENEYLASVAKSVTVDIVARVLLSSTTAEPMESMTQTALGYSVSGTYLNPGGGLYIKKSELARLGLRRQQIGTIDLRGAQYGD